jgi:hypothetical protein
LLTHRFGNGWIKGFYCHNGDGQLAMQRAEQFFWGIGGTRLFGASIAKSLEHGAPELDVETGECGRFRHQSAAELNSSRLVGKIILGLKLAKSGYSPCS